MQSLGKITHLLDAYDEIKLNEILQKISVDLSIHYDQMAIIETNIKKLTEGYMSPEDFAKMIQTLGLPDEKRVRLVGLLNEQVFLPLRKAVNKLEEEEKFIFEEVPEVPISDYEKEDYSPEKIDSDGLSMSDNGVLSKAGIIMTNGVEKIEEEVKMGPVEKEVATLSRMSGMAVQPAVENIEIPIPNINRDDVISGIENPMHTMSTPLSSTDIGQKSRMEGATGIVANKMNGSFSLPNTKTDYSLPKMEEDTLRHRDRVDPYRENL